MTGGFWGRDAQPLPQQPTSTTKSFGSKIAPSSERLGLLKCRNDRDIKCGWTSSFPIWEENVCGRDWEQGTRDGNSFRVLKQLSVLLRILRPGQSSDDGYNPRIYHHSSCSSSPLRHGPRYGSFDTRMVFCSEHWCTSSSTFFLPSYRWMPPLILLLTPPLPFAWLSLLPPTCWDWLNVVPSPAFGLHLLDQENRPCLQYWLGLTIVAEGARFPVCRGIADPFGDRCDGEWLRKRDLQRADVRQLEHVSCLAQIKAS